MGFAENVGRVDRSARQLLGGEEMLYKAGGIGPGTPVTGIFDAAYVLQSRGDDVGVCATAPAVFLQLADLPSDPQVDTAATIVRSGITYKVDHPETAGMGSVHLVLRKVI